MVMAAVDVVIVAVTVPVLAAIQAIAHRMTQFTTKLVRTQLKMGFTRNIYAEKLRFSSN